MQKLELLAPAKNLECGMTAISHGADAVYIGASRFGARAAAGNSLDDIQQLCEYAHQFGARVYVTINTIIYEDELAATKEMLEALNTIGVDALLVQDMGILELIEHWDAKVPFRMELHASTQTDNRTAEKVRWLQEVGFKRAVLARELSAREIARIHHAVPEMDLEVFVHGALCVSYSGVCYASQHCFHRSANRGECAQFCRMKFDLLDSNQREVEHQRHLLSMRDMCQLEHLQELAESGACSFKIEGRLKDVEYVKNVVSAYSKELNKIVNSHPDLYSRASYGRVDYAFEPDLRKTFNRGFTTYFLNGRQANIANFDTPKAMGEYVGKVKEIRGNSFNVSGTAAFENGDGLCFINDAHELEGFRINKAEGNRLYPLKLPKRLRPGTALYRNNDVAFSRLLANVTARRRLQLAMRFGATSDGFYLCASSHEAEIKATANIVFEHQAARQSQRENIIKQLAKLGNTIFECQEIKIENHADEYFVPSSLLAELRRTAVDQLESQLKQAKQTAPEANVHNQPSSNVENIVPKAYKAHSYLYNISNHLSKQFYKAHGLTSVQPALELSASANPLVMQCRHCIRFALGFCEKRGGKRPTWDEPLFLRLGDGRRFRLEFDCKECQMNIYAE